MRRFQFSIILKSQRYKLKLDKNIIWRIFNLKFNLKKFIFLSKKKVVDNVI